MLARCSGILYTVFRKSDFLKENPMAITVSVVIPTFNRKNFLEKLIQSLLEQSYPKENYEIIVADDGSTDGTEDLIRQMQKKTALLKYYRHENRGPSSARNLGIEKSSGTIIGFVDSDVIADRDWIRNALPYFEDETVMGVEGKTIVPNPQDMTPFTHEAENRKGNNFLSCNIFYRKTALEKAGGFDERFYDGQLKVYHRMDSDLAFTILENGGKIPFAPRVLVRHPAVKARYSKYFKRAAQDGFFEALLSKKHPSSYRKRLKWYDGWAFPVPYYGYYASLAGLIFALIRTSNAVFLLSILLLAFSHAAALFMVCRKKRVYLKDFVILLFQFLLIPFLRLYWVLRGSIKFGKLVW